MKLALTAPTIAVFRLGPIRLRKRSTAFPCCTGCDADKPYAWPAYIANLRARHRCPACLLVITIDDAVARWAGRSIELGPGTQCHPWVVGPSNMPAVTELKDAQENVELAVLSAIEYQRSANVPLARRVASTAIVASADIDAERSRLYLDLVLISLSEHAPTGD